MATTKRREYVAPDVKQYGAVEQVTQSSLTTGPGDILSTILELITGEEVEGCPLFQTCAS